MKVTRVQAYALQEPVKESFYYAQGRHASRGSTVVRLETENGLVGVGECFGPPRVLKTIIDQVYAPQVMGRSLWDRGAIWQDLYNSLRDHGQKGLAVEAQSGIDIALWDLQGKAAGQPVAHLLGGYVRQRVPAYATGLYPQAPDGGPHEGLLDEAEAIMAQGFTAIKIKVGFGPERDASFVTALRRRLGPAVRIMVDANHAYDAQTAIWLGRRCEAADVYWFEEPVLPEDLDGYVDVRAALDLAVAGGEAEFTLFGMRDLIRRRAVDIVQPDTTACGGITQVMQIAQLAAAHNIRCLPHVWGTHIGMAASLQVLAALPDIPPSLNPQPPYLEYDVAEHGFRDKVVAESFRLEDGWMEIPRRPGLGVTLDMDAVREFSVSP